MSRYKFVTNTFKVDKPIQTGLPEGLHGMFSTSTAISKAVDMFWDAKLAKRGTIGQTREHDTHYEVDIKYRQEITKQEN